MCHCSGSRDEYATDVPIEAVYTLKKGTQSPYRSRMGLAQWLAHNVHDSLEHHRAQPTTWRSIACCLSTTLPQADLIRAHHVDMHCKCNAKVTMAKGGNHLRFSKPAFIGHKLSLGHGSTSNPLDPIGRRLLHRSGEGVRLLIL